MKPTINTSHLFLIIFISLVISIITHSVLLCRIVLFCIMMLCINIGRSEKFFVNPILLFAITPFSLLIYTNIGDTFMVDLTFETCFLAIINMLSFIIAYNYTPSFKNEYYCTGNTSASSLQVQSIVFYIISLIGTIIPAIASIVWMFSIVSIVCALKSKKKWMLLFVIAVFLISALGFTSKSTMLTYCITFIICFEKYYVNTNKQKKLVKWALGVGVVFMIFSFSFANKDRGFYNADEGVDRYASQGINWEYNSNLFMPYMYITNGWTNLQYVMETQDSRTYGLWMAKPLLGYLQMSDTLESNYKIIPYSSFNTYAYMTYGFKDFGYWLSVLMSLFLGYFVKRVYSRYRISRSPYDVAAYILVAQATLEMFFSNHFFTQSYPFTIVILMAAIKWIMRQRKTLPELESKYTD